MLIILKGTTINSLNKKISVDLTEIFTYYKYLNYIALNDISRPFTECVNAPTEI